MDHIDADEQSAWIAERTGVPEADVQAVLDLEFEFMIGVGIVEGANDYQLRHYSRDELTSLPPEVDIQRLAQDAETRLGIPEAVAHKVFEAEFEFLKMRGLV